MKKKSRRARRSQKHSRILTVICLIIVLAVFFYKNSPAFRSRVDSLAEAAAQKTEFFFSKDSSEQQAPQAARPQKVETSGETAKKTARKESPSSRKQYVALPPSLELPFPCRGSDHEIRNYSHYSICYRESYEQAEWSAYSLDDSQLTKNASRSNDFRPDPQISTGSATPADYKSSGYDRGHLSPAADFAFDQNAMSETFYMSNMSPQKGGFNRGIWKNLEAQVRDWAQKFGRVYVVSGPVLEKAAGSYATIGVNAVAVPEFYYKVILAPLYENEADRASKDDSKSVAAIGFILPNEKSDASFFDYAVSVDEVEKRTGLDFFYALEDSTESESESSVNLSLW